MEKSRKQTRKQSLNYREQNDVCLANWRWIGGTGEIDDEY